jgi:hypothetical protein
MRTKGGQEGGIRLAQVSDRGDRKILLAFNFAVVFILMYFRFRQVNKN